MKTKKAQKKKAQYECECCGAVASRPQGCCGEPMKKVSK